MRTRLQNNNRKNEKGTFTKRSVLMYGLLVLAVITAAAVIVQAAPGGSNDSSAAGGMWDGTGTSADPYKIDDVADLAKLADEVNDSHNNFDGKYFVLTADLDLDIEPFNKDDGWIPIGHSNSHPFSGIFDGNGHTIIGLFINYGSYDNTGLFGWVDNGKIMELGVVDADITGGNGVGGVAGSITSGTTVENCYYTGDVKGNDYVGGVVGINNRGTVQNCYNTGDVNGNNNVGGVVGYTIYGMVTNCYNTCIVTGSVNVGGVVGYNYSTVENCYSTGEVTGKDNVGGVVGYNDYGTVENCYNTGDVNGTGNDVGGPGDIGGVVGYINGGTVENCYNVGEVTGTVSDYIGGVAGNNYNGTVTNCFFLKEDGGVNNELNAICINAGSIVNSTSKGGDEMRTQTSFTDAGWDFDDVWGIYLKDGDINAPGYGYPYIKTIGNNILVVPVGGSKDYDEDPAPSPPTWGLIDEDNYDEEEHPLIGELSYDPVDPVDVGIYKITLGSLEGPYYQISFADDVVYEIFSVIPELPEIPVEPNTGGKEYFVTTSSDTFSVISPAGKVSVQKGGNRTFSFSAAEGYHVSFVAVDGILLSQEQIDTGLYTFSNVVSNHTIDVKSLPGVKITPITLTINIAEGNGYAEYSVNGSQFVKYVSSVSLSASDSVAVKAYADKGSHFVKWESPYSTAKATETSFASVSSSLLLDLYFAEDGEGGSNQMWITVAIVIVMVIVGAVVVHVIFFRGAKT